MIPNSRQEGPRIASSAEGYRDSTPIARKRPALVKPSLIFDSRGEGMSMGAAEVGRHNQNAILGEISLCRTRPERFAESRRYFIYPGSDQFFAQEIPRRKTMNKNYQTLTPMRAIRAKCLDCCCNNHTEVKFCPSTDCPLYRFRSGHNPDRPKRVLSEEKRAVLAERMRKLHRSKA